MEKKRLNLVLVFAGLALIAALAVLGLANMGDR